MDYLQYESANGTKNFPRSLILTPNCFEKPPSKTVDLDGDATCISVSEKYPEQLIKNKIPVEIIKNAQTCSKIYMKMNTIQELERVQSLLIRASTLVRTIVARIELIIAIIIVISSTATLMIRIVVWVGLISAIVIIATSPVGAPRPTASLFLNPCW